MAYRNTMKENVRGRNKSRRDDEALKKKMRHMEGIKEIKPDDYELFKKLVTDHGKIIPARLTGATAKQQRQIKRAIRKARVMGLML